MTLVFHPFRMRELQSPYTMYQTWEVGIGDGGEAGAGIGLFRWHTFSMPWISYTYIVKIQKTLLMTKD